MIKSITINNNNEKSIKSVERLKARLENKGFNLIETKQIGFDRWVLIYEV